MCGDFVTSLKSLKWKTEPQARSTRLSNASSNRDRRHQVPKRRYSCSIQIDHLDLVHFVNYIRSATGDKARSIKSNSLIITNLLLLQLFELLDYPRFIPFKAGGQQQHPVDAQGPPPTPSTISNKTINSVARVAANWRYRRVLWIIILKKLNPEIT